MGEAKKEVSRQLHARTIDSASSHAARWPELCGWPTQVEGSNLTFAVSGFASGFCSVSEMIESVSAVLSFRLALPTCERREQHSGSPGVAR